MEKKKNKVMVLVFWEIKGIIAALKQVFSTFLATCCKILNQVL